MPRPTLGEPVKVTLSTPGCRTSASPTTLPLPQTTLSAPGGKPRFEEQLGDAQHRQRREFRRLDHHGAAAGECGRDFPHADHEREIPRHDGRDDADRFAHRVGQRIRARRYHLSGDLVAPAGVVAHRVDDRGHVLAPHGRKRLAGIQTLDLDQFLLMLLQQRCRALQDAAAFGGAQRAPNLQRRARRADSFVHVGLAALRNFGDRLFGRRIKVDAVFAGRWRHMFAVDE